MLGDLHERKTRSQAQANNVQRIKEEDPLTYKDALLSKNKENWLIAVQKELNALIQNETFGEAQDLPKECKTVGARWVFKTKYDTTGKI